MSRCFPFPPPGYEKKARIDEVDILKKEKQREKKHKKEKRDKEKRESKEKREKEGKDGKHREKKDKKEKNRERKKDKDKDRDKEKDKGRDRDKSKTATADDKGFPGKAEVPNAGKVHQKEIKQNDKGSLFEEKITKQYTGNNGEKARPNNHLAEENKDSKFLLELERRIKDDNGGAGNQLVQCTNTDLRKDEGPARFVAKGSGTWPDGKGKLKDKVFDAKKIDGKGMRAEARPIANATVKNHVGNFHPRVDGMPRILENKTLEAGNLHPRVEGMPKIMENNINRTLEAKVDGRDKVREKKDEGKEKVKEKKDEGKERVREKKDEGKERVREKKDEGKERVREKKDEAKEKAREKKDEAKEKIKENKDGGMESIKEKKDGKRGDKRKAKEKEKKGHGKDKDRDKEKKKEEKAVEHNEVKTIELNKLKESHKAGPIGLNSFSQVSKNSHENAFSGENPKKRKDIEPNGVPLANDNWPSKMSRPSSSHPLSGNGRILEPCQISIPNTSDRPGAAPSVKVENKEGKINGVIDTPFAISSDKTHSAIVPADPLTEPSAKPPHPDTKYLSQVYSVPKMEWSGFDDQEWLFGSKISHERKPVVGSSEAGETLQVWAEGLHIEPADVFALPYVIPY